MIGQKSSYAEIAVKISPAHLWSSGSVRLTSDVGSRLSEAKRSYDALIYTHLNIPTLSPPEKPPPGQPREVAGLPLAGKEELTVRWSRYQEYLAAFVEGDKMVYHMRERLLETMPEGLEVIFSQPLPTTQPVRVWWASDTPELEDLPWELATHRGRSYPAEKFSFVRGLPPDNPLPILPVGQKLRLAFIHDPAFTPPPLVQAIHTLPPTIEVVDFPNLPRKSLEKVAQEGFELIHIVADGVVSSAYEGILYFHGGRSTSPEISPGELSALLRSSRASVLCLSEQDYSNPDTIPIGGQLVPSVYRAFACLASSRLPLPTMVVPLGPLQQPDLHAFWSSFYAGLGETLSVHHAMARSQLKGFPPPVAVFMRHVHETLFRRKPAARRGAINQPRAIEPDPAAIGAELQLSHELLEQLKAHNKTYGSLPDSVNKFIEKESARQGDLAASLDPWLNPEEGEVSQ